MTEDHVAVSLKQFLVTEQQCPPEWKSFDLYLIRDDNTDDSNDGNNDECVFYVGQSESAFARVWDHFLGGFKGRSVIGRFILCNWATSMKFIVELWSAQSERFADVGYDRDAAERALIEQYTPCFNVSLNRAPRALPPHYRPTTAKPLCSRSPRKLIMEASLALRAEQRQQWLSDDPNRADDFI